jgi:hypothetical protein
MKSCPTCNRTFEDSFTFCLADGALLSAPYDIQRAPAALKSDPKLTEVLPGNSSLPSQSTKPSHEPEPKKPSRLKRIIRAMIKCGLLGILPGILVGVIAELANHRWWSGNFEYQLEAVAGGALWGFVGGAILFPPLWRFIKYVWKD